MVDGNGLENRRAGNGTVGSNPTPSAIRLATLAHNKPGYLADGR